MFTIAKANDIVRAAWDKSDAAGKMSGFGALGPAASWTAGREGQPPADVVRQTRCGPDRAAAKKWQDTAEMFDPNPVIDIDLGEGTVKLGAPYGPRKKFGGTAATTTAQRAPPAPGNAASSNGILGGEQQPELERSGDLGRRRRRCKGVRYAQAAATDAARQAEEERPGQKAADATADRFR